ncbi:unnamed protein product [Closterium sp. Yama58-4]|nr:unnamed protein product [Closterium sp. Yama58-4]
MGARLIDVYSAVGDLGQLQAFLKANPLSQSAEAATSACLHFQQDLTSALSLASFDPLLLTPNDPTAGGTELLLDGLESAKSALGRPLLSLSAEGYPTNPAAAIPLALSALECTLLHDTLEQHSTREQCKSLQQGRDGNHQTHLHNLFGSGGLGGESSSLASCRDSIGSLLWELPSWLGVLRACHVAQPRHAEAASVLRLHLARQARLGGNLRLASRLLSGSVTASAEQQQVRREEVKGELGMWRAIEVCEVAHADERCLDAVKGMWSVCGPVMVDMASAAAAHIGADASASPAVHVLRRLKTSPAVHLSPHCNPLAAHACLKLASWLLPIGSFSHGFGSTSGGQLAALDWLLASTANGSSLVLPPPLVSHGVLSQQHAASMAAGSSFKVSIRAVHSIQPNLIQESDSTALFNPTRQTYPTGQSNPEKLGVLSVAGAAVWAAVGACGEMPQAWLAYAQWLDCMADTRMPRHAGTLGADVAQGDGTGGEGEGRRENEEEEQEVEVDVVAALPASLDDDYSTDAAGAPAGTTGMGALSSEQGAISPPSFQLPDTLSLSPALSPLGAGFGATTAAPAVAETAAAASGEVHATTPPSPPGHPTLPSHTPPQPPSDSPSRFKSMGLKAFHAGGKGGVVGEVEAGGLDSGLEVRCVGGVSGASDQVEECLQQELTAVLTAVLGGGEQMSHFVGEVDSGDGAGGSAAVADVSAAAAPAAAAAAAVAAAVYQLLGTWRAARFRALSTRHLAARAYMRFLQLVGSCVGDGGRCGGRVGGGGGDVGRCGEETGRRKSRTRSKGSASGARELGKGDSRMCDREGFSEGCSGSVPGLERQERGQKGWEAVGMGGAKQSGWEGRMEEGTGSCGAVVAGGSAVLTCVAMRVVDILMQHGSHMPPVVAAPVDVGCPHAWQPVLPQLLAAISAQRSASVRLQLTRVLLSLASAAPSLVVYPLCAAEKHRLQHLSLALASLPAGLPPAAAPPTPAAPPPTPAAPHPTPAAPLPTPPAAALPTPPAASRATPSAPPPPLAGLAGSARAAAAPSSVDAAHSSDPVDDVAADLAWHVALSQATPGWHQLRAALSFLVLVWRPAPFHPSSCPSSYPSSCPSSDPSSCPFRPVSLYLQNPIPNIDKSQCFPIPNRST